MRANFFARTCTISRCTSTLGEIDTLNEKYQADIYYEARWTQKRINLSALGLSAQDQQKLHLNENTTVRVNELNPSVCWQPQLFIENAIGQIGEQDRWFTLKKMAAKSEQLTSSLSINAEVCEHRRVKGVFWEKLELNHVSSRSSEMFFNSTTTFSSSVSSRCSRFNHFHYKSSPCGKLHSHSR